MYVLYTVLVIIVERLKIEYDFEEFLDKKRNLEVCFFRENIPKLDQRWKTIPKKSFERY